MAKAQYEKSIRISDKAKKNSIMPSYVEGTKAAKIQKPKSLTPPAKMKKK